MPNGNERGAERPTIQLEREVGEQRKKVSEVEGLLRSSWVTTKWAGTVGLIVIILPLLIGCQRVFQTAGQVSEGNENLTRKVRDLQTQTDELKSRVRDLDSQIK